MRNKSFWLGLFIGVVVALIVVIVMSACFGNLESLGWLQNNLIAIQAIGSLAILVSAIVALCAYRSNLSYQASKAFLEESIKILERALGIFTGNGKDSLPKNDRVVWLTTARMLLRFKNMRSKITAPEHQEIYEEHEEFTRFQINRIFEDNKEKFTEEYFNPYQKEYLSYSIEPKSIGVIYDFARWDKKEDPINQVNEQRIFDKQNFPTRYSGVRGYLRKYHNKNFD